jgi:hypothetical protein
MPRTPTRSRLGTGQGRDSESSLHRRGGAAWLSSFQPEGPAGPHPSQILCHESLSRSSLRLSVAMVAHWQRLATVTLEIASELEVYGPVTVSSAGIGRRIQARYSHILNCHMSHGPGAGPGGMQPPPASAGPPGRGVPCRGSPGGTGDINLNVDPLAAARATAGRCEPPAAPTLRTRPAAMHTHRDLGHDRRRHESSPRLSCGRAYYDNRTL